MITVPVVFTIDKAFLPPAYIAITSLIDNASEQTVYDIIVLYQGEKKDNVCVLFDIVKDSRHNMKIQNISDIEMNVPRTTKCWPSVVYVRLYLTSILSDYDKVIFSDVDVLFKGDLSEVFCTDMTGFEWGGVVAELNCQKANMHQYYEDNKHPYIYWSGFMIMNLQEMRNRKWEEKCNANIEKYKERLYMFDLEIMNLTAENIKRLPLRYVYLQGLYDAQDIVKTEEYNWISRIYTYEDLEKEKENVVIVHYAGKVGRIGKPWLRYNAPQYYADYLKRLPISLKRQNNVARNWKNIKVFVRIILEIVHLVKKEQ